MEGEQYFVKTLEELKRILQQHENVTCTKFCTTSTTKSFTDSTVQLKERMQIYWKNNTPHLLIGTKYYECHQGKDKNVYHKKRYATNRDLKAINENHFTKRYNLTKGTKKMDCPVKIKVDRLIKYPDYKISDPVTKWKKDKFSQQIKDNISRGVQCGEEGFLFTLPKAEDHKCHRQEKLTESVDCRVEDFIEELVEIGERKVSVISRLISEFVENELQETDRSKRSFFPTNQTVGRIVSRFRRQKGDSPVDQENSELFLNTLNSNNDHVYFKPCTESEDIVYENPKTEESTKRDLINKIKSSLGKLESALCNLEKEQLEELDCIIEDATNATLSYVTKDSDSGLLNDLMPTD